MVAFGLFSWKARVCSVLFASSTLAVLQNVTVDDAVTTGSVVPGFLPSADNWAQGNSCVGCAAKPDPSFAYNGTWHDTTFYPDGNVGQSIQFSFVGSGLYIFFILANNLGANISTLTNVDFILDGTKISNFNHPPTSSADYGYNQTVFANNTMPYGQHTMTIAPVNDTENAVLILFDYLIYTTDVSTTSTDSSATSSQTSSGSATTSSGTNVGAIVGGTIAGASVLVSTIAIMCYRRYKRRKVGQSCPPGMEVADPFTSSQVSPPFAHFTSLPIQQLSPEPLSAEPVLGYKGVAGALSVPVQPSNHHSVSPRSSSNALASSGTSGGNAQVLEEVGMLREEVARLRRIQDRGWNGSETDSEAPPGYFTQEG